MTSTSSTTGLSTQVYQVFIKASPERIWEAITTPELTRRFFHRASITVTPARYLSLAPDGETRWSDGAVMEFDSPRRLVHAWNSLYDSECAAEPTSRVTWEIEPAGDGVCKLTVVHDRLDGAPKTAARVAGPGWMSVLSALKTLLETGNPLFP